MNIKRLKSKMIKSKSASVQYLVIEIGNIIIDQTIQYQGCLANRFHVFVLKIIELCKTLIHFLDTVLLMAYCL